jgi:hypothetical protein
LFWLDSSPSESLLKLLLFLLRLLLLLSLIKNRLYIVKINIYKKLKSPFGVLLFSLRKKHLRFFSGPFYCCRNGFWKCHCCCCFCRRWREKEVMARALTSTVICSRRTNTTKFVPWYWYVLSPKINPVSQTVRRENKTRRSTHYAGNTFLRTVVLLAMLLVLDNVYYDQRYKQH